MVGPLAERVSQRINKLPKWARDYIHQVHTFVGADEVEELIFLRDRQRQLVKFIAELKAENRRLKAQLPKHPAKIKSRGRVRR